MVAVLKKYILFVLHGCLEIANKCLFIFEDIFDILIDAAHVRLRHLLDFSCQIIQVVAKGDDLFLVVLEMEGLLLLTHFTHNLVFAVVLDAAKLNRIIMVLVAVNSQHLALVLLLHRIIHGTNKLSILFFK